MDTFIEMFTEMGRIGGALLMLLAAGIAVFVWWDFQTTGSFFLAAPPVAVILGFVGLALLIKGNPHARPRVERPELTEALVFQLSDHERPYHLCTSCRAVSGPPPCLRCGSAASVMEIRDDEDLRMAIVSME